MYECFHCLNRSVIWDADFTFKDYDLEGEGIVHHCHCANCGAEIEYYVPVTEEDIFSDGKMRAEGMYYTYNIDVDKIVKIEKTEL